MVDYYFYYKYNLRFLLLLKHGNIRNSYLIPNIMKMVLFFSLYKVEDLDDVQCYIIFIYLNFFLVVELF